MLAAEERQLVGMRLNQPTGVTKNKKTREGDVEGDIFEMRGGRKRRKAPFGVALP
jgi:hypothetical protein